GGVAGFAGRRVPPSWSSSTRRGPERPAVPTEHDGAPLGAVSWSGRPRVCPAAPASLCETAWLTRSPVVRSSLRRAAGSWSAIGADTGIRLLKALSSEVPAHRCRRVWRRRVRRDGEKGSARGGGEERGERGRPV